MSLYAYSAELHDPVLGFVIFQDEVELDVSFSMEGCEPRITVEGVYKDGISLFNGSPVLNKIAHMVADQAQDDDWLIGRVVEDYAEEMPRAA
ncbi:hypothetical protein K1X45_15855 [Pseudochrobactrum sp. Wa41.01b-1]|uniref:hypothetical protein n=1 Tax=Pseudochrobactrum TaxID=354349 RepID=UPI001C6884DE|nr:MULTISPECIES: hypothetical protein [unclassified Pseudochrobactrum]MDM8346243.1 hypothetical protein [Pseudochrobactrum sp. sp1633]QYM72882.1 hypothetical protein K1X45_15855 [Pseudochrobactrum sp. Wa41.01b-1]